ncbi:MULTISPECIES: 2TM domain-containing protein [unclassified Lysinibacillus]|uniref:2TM domain-containing protein n=1 Tax=unclassified Lysinibacillus TaxID=2636778 RepID=UPI0010491EEF|nr:MULTISPECIES: 2TM domain-containing protein [unclassified Lysinibacillus]MDD1502124.1 2TM domain-containing protein [Lysinibacillus sp. CNPSo 3705]UPW82237.1 2TM domain-containing protein [Lysinibacillus sp. Ag94]
MSDNEKYERSIKRVRALKSFYIHLFVYIIVNLGLIIINLFSSPGSLWFIYTLLGWGIGIVAHGISVFSRGKFLGEEWEKRQLEKYMNKK